MRTVGRSYSQAPIAAYGGTAGPVAAPVVQGGYYRNAPIVAVVLMAVIAARLPEALPFLAPIRPALTFGIAGLAAILLQSRQDVVREVTTHPMMLLLVGMTAWAVVTAPFALWTALALKSAIFILTPMLMMTFVILACEPNARNLRTLKLGFMGSIAAHAAVLLLSRGGGDTGRLRSLASLDPNDLALLMVLAFPFACGMALNERGLRRWLALISAVTFVLVVVFSNSRGGTLALLVASVVYVLSAKGVRKGLALTLFLIAGLATWQLAPQSFRDRMATIGNVEDDYNTWAYDGRKQIWARARGYIKENPVTGVGMLNFTVAEGNTLTAAGTRGKWSTTHNSYLQVASELGLVGAAFFFAIFGLAIASAFKLRQRRPEFRNGQPEFLAALAGAAMGGYFLSQAYFYAFYALVAITLFALRVDRAAYIPAAAPVANMAASRSARGFRSLRTAHLRSR
jgi:O-antigen ligase